MNLLQIAWKSIRQRWLVSALTALSVALGVMLMVAVLVTGGVVERSFGRRGTPFDLIVAPKGSDLQTVLAVIYRFPERIEPLPYLYYLELKEDPLVEEAVPVAFGDATREGGFPILATVGKYFEAGVDRETPFVLTEGRGLRDGFDAVIGSTVARTNGWGVGDAFKLVHGGAAGGHVHDEEFTVVGVLGPTGTPNDRTAFVQINGFYAVSGHEKPTGEAVNRWRAFNGEEPLEGRALVREGNRLLEQTSGGTPDIQKEVSAILVNAKRFGPEDPGTRIPFLAGDINEGFRAAAVNPAQPVRRLREQFVDPVTAALVALSAVIVAVSGVGIFVSIYNSMSERLREIAVMRALGASRGTVLSIVLAESVLLTVGGGLVGLALGHLAVFALPPVLRERSGLVFDPWAFSSTELWILPGLLLVAVLAGLIPGLRAYRADVAGQLG